jgi:multisubunit Na+/H+ antiporter MnhB subunit
LTGFVVEAAAFLAFAGALAGGFGAPGALAGGLAVAAFFGSVGLGLAICAIAAASPSNANAPDSKATFFVEVSAANFSPTSAGFFDVLSIARRVRWRYPYLDCGRFGRARFPGGVLGLPISAIILQE